MRRVIGVVAVVVILGVGCAGAASKDKDRMSKGKDKGGEDKVKDRAQSRLAMADQAERAPAGRVDAAGEKEVKKSERKIKYTGDVSLVVENLDKSEAKLHELIKECDGYIARQEVQGVRDRRRQGSWTVRIPAASGDKFREAVSKLGELTRSKLDSEDITDAYYDTQAVIKNLEAREKALRELYEKTIANAKLTDLLQVDRELAQVRGEINTFKGRLQRWDKEVAFTTYTVTMIDRRDYVPPTSPAFGTTIGRTFSGSVDALIEVMKFFVLVVVAVVPWLPIPLVLGGAAWFVIRRLIRSIPPVPRKVVVAEVAPQSPPPAP